MEVEWVRETRRARVQRAQDLARALSSDNLSFSIRLLSLVGLAPFQHSTTLQCIANTPRNISYILHAIYLTLSYTYRSHYIAWDITQTHFHLASACAFFLIPFEAIWHFSWFYKLPRNPTFYISNYILHHVCFSRRFACVHSMTIALSH